MQCQVFLTLSSGDISYKTEAFPSPLGWADCCQVRGALNGAHHSCITYDKFKLWNIVNQAKYSELSASKVIVAKECVQSQGESIWPGSASNSFPIGEIPPYVIAPHPNARQSTGQWQARNRVPLFTDILCI